MDDIALPGREDLEVRLKDLARRNCRDSLDDLELRHLAEVASNHTLLLADTLKDERLSRIVRRDALGGIHLFGPLTSREEDLTAETIHHMGKIPDDMKGIGDKCLYDVGLFGRHAYKGQDLIQLGSRAYELASEVLEMLSDDRRLKEFFRQNRLWNMPIEEEIVFLKQCGSRFTLHAELLRELGLFDPGDRRSGQNHKPGHHPTEGNTVDFRSAPGPLSMSLTSPTDRPKRAYDASTPPPITPPASVSDAAGLDSLGNRRYADPPGFAGGLMGERPEFLPEDMKPALAVAEMDRLPRKDLLSLYERMLLFGGLDIEDLRSELKRVVIDQQSAVDALCDELSLYAMGTQSLNRPATYFFVGPTGVGKNHLIESLVKCLEHRWDFEIPMLQLEGPQYTYPSDINELKGAARGFIRSDEEGILTEFYSRSSQSPFSVILVDEVEKSHPQLRKFFLSLMDRGTTMDNRGQMLNFINTMIVYTSNIGYSRLQTSTGSIGFLEETDQQMLRDQEVMRDLKKILSPEFVNRLTVIKFTPLSRGSIQSIFDLEFDKIAMRYMAMHGLELTVTPRAREELIHRGYSPEFGARPMARMLNTVCNIEVSKKIKRDESRSPRADRTLRDYIREVKEGKRAYDAASVQRRVMGSARVQVPYNGIAVDFDGGTFLYLPQGRERGSH